jgi:hypothetical protein
VWQSLHLLGQVFCPLQNLFNSSLQFIPVRHVVAPCLSLTLYHMVTTFMPKFNPRERAQEPVGGMVVRLAVLPMKSR